MSKPAPIRIERVLPRPESKTGALLSTAEVQAILRVAYLAGEADGRIADEEQDVFAELAQSLKKLAANDPDLADAALDKMLDGLADDLEKRGVEPCLADAAKALGKPIAKDIAYKVVVAMSLADLDQSDDESDFDEQLVDALGLNQEQADTLADDVYAALEDDE